VVNGMRDVRLFHCVGGLGMVAVRELRVGKGSLMSDILDETNPEGLKNQKCMLVSIPHSHILVLLTCTGVHHSPHIQNVTSQPIWHPNLIKVSAKLVTRSGSIYRHEIYDIASQQNLGHQTGHHYTNKSDRVDLHYED
jgi:hypothetical protein